MKHAFERFSDAINRMVGAPTAFVCAVTVVFVWALTGPIFHFSDTWQLVINTGTTIVTFLIGFAISNQNNRSAKHDHVAMKTLTRMEREHGQELSRLSRINRQQLALLVIWPLLAVIGIVSLRRGRK